MVTTNTMQEKKVKKASVSVNDQSLLSKTQKAGLRFAAEVGGRVTEYQRKAFERVIEGVGEFQDKTGDRVYKIASDSRLVPNEGAELIAEWNKAVKQTRKDVEKAALRSFELVERFYTRVKKENSAPRPAAKRSAETVTRTAPVEVISPA